jgi:hypothetical protein
MKRVISIVLVLALSLSALILTSCKEKGILNKFEDVVLENIEITSFRASASEGMASSRAYPVKTTSNKDDISMMLNILKQTENGFEECSEDNFDLYLHAPIVQLTLYRGYTEFLYINLGYDGYVYLYEITGTDEGLEAKCAYKSVDKLNCDDFMYLYDCISRDL